jgi:hypothetical protein
MSENYFNILNAVDVSENIEKKGKLSYLSWAYAWIELKKMHPDATYTVYENAAGLDYHTDGRYCWVKTGVTVNGIEHIEYLPILDARSLSIKLEKVTAFDVYKTIQRSITKACARHGLGIRIYAGEDLPEGDEPDAPPAQPPKKNEPDAPPAQPPKKNEPVKPDAPPPAKKAPEKPAAPPPPTQQPRMAAPGQKKFIIDNATDEEYEATMKAYGAELENMPFAHAEKLIAKIQRRMNPNG